MGTRSRLTIALKALGYLWSSPYGVVGLVLAVLCFLAGWVHVAVWREGTFQVVLVGPFAEAMQKLRWGGTTIGWAILFYRLPNAAIQRHEERHVGQTLVLGVLFLPVYAALFVLLVVWALWEHLWAGAFRRQHLLDVVLAIFARAYQLHPLERDARRAATIKVLGGPPLEPR
jgi:hypothetical protein